MPEQELWMLEGKQLKNNEISILGLEPTETLLHT